MCGNARDKYTNCGGDAIVQCGNRVCVILAWTVMARPVWWCQKVRFLEVIAILGLTPSEMTQCIIPPSELVQDEVQQLLILELITMST